MKVTNLSRAVLFAVLCTAVLGTVAFWPAPRWAPPARPPLRAPIVFDQLHNLPPDVASASPVK